MTVSSTTSSAIRYGDGVTTEFSFGFSANSAADIKAYLVNVLTLEPIPPTSYTITLSAIEESGTIEFDVAPADGAKIYIARETAVNQQVSVSSQTRYDPRVVGNVWDKLTRLIQELADKIALAVKTVPGNDPNLFLAALQTYNTLAKASADAAAASEAAAAASAAEALAKENSMLRDRGDWATLTLYSPSDIFTDGGRSYITQTTHIASSIAADLSANRIRVFADKGASGSGSGDMNNADNLSGLTNKPLAYATIGGKAVGKVDLLGFSLVDPVMVRTQTEGGIALDETSETEFPVVKAVATFARARAVESMWYPYDKTNDSDSSHSGLIYDFSTHGVMSEIESPNFEDGWEYRFRLHLLSHNAVGGATLVLRLWREADSAWSSDANIYGSMGAGLEVSGQFIAHDPRFAAIGHSVSGHVYRSDLIAVGSANSFDFYFAYNTQKIGKIKIQLSSGGFDSGTVWMDRRKVVR